MEEIDKLIAALLGTVPATYADRTTREDTFVYAVGLAKIMAHDLRRS